MNNKIAKATAYKLVYFPFFFIGAVILYLPVLGKNFVSDDYIVLKRVCLEGIIQVKGFFRPLSDWTIYLNYWLNGFNPLAFNLANIFIHAANSFLLYLFCLRWKWNADEDLQHRFAFIAGILFLTYPFHNEAIVWLLGRGAAIACSCLISALLVFVSGWNERVKLLGVSICYFTGLLAYESIVILPLLILILLWGRKSSAKAFNTWIMCFFITGSVHLLLRYRFSGAVPGEYVENLFSNSWQSFPGNTLKVISRLLIPPIRNSYLFAGISLIIFSGIGIGIFFLRIVKRKKLAGRQSLLRPLIAMIAATLIIPIVVAVSTRTSEGDRLLYIPSVFVCCLISFMLCNWFKTKTATLLVVLLTLAYQIMFLELNNYNWYRAGRATFSLIKFLKSETSVNPTFIVNLPNEINGAYVFREGFKDALVINQIDTSKVIVINKLSKELETPGGPVWVPVFYPTMTFIPPGVELYHHLKQDSTMMAPGIIRYVLPQKNKLFYWDQYKFVPLKKSGTQR